MMIARILILVTLVSAGLSAEVVGIDVTERSAVLDGKAFGKVGAYERIVGKAHFAVDPNDPDNAIIHDLQLAPRNAKGLVEFSSDIYILRPVDPDKGSGTVLFEVSNRGGKAMLAFNRASRSLDPRTAEEFGDGLLMERGYTLLWVGWQYDLVDSPDALRLSAPVASGIEGWVRSLVTPLEPAKTFSVAGRAGHLPYEAIDVNDPDARLITRQHMDSPGKDIPRDKWRFLDPSTVEVDGGLTPGRSYEVIYRSKDPGVAGLGPAAIRDFVSFLKFGGEGHGLMAELPQGIERAIGYGSSQSGRFLRQYLYDGFNADEQGRMVFDGAWPHISGGARGSFTHRFAQPTRQDPYYAVAVFPFRDLTDTDPVTGQTAGLLEKYQDNGAMPKIFYTVTSSEYFARSASLVTTTLDGMAQAPLADTSRFYYMPGTQHGSGSVPPAPQKLLQNRANSNDYWPLMRAFLVSFDDWVTNGTEPPPSRYPSVGELAALEDLNFPKIPDFTPLGYQRRAMRLDFGPQFLGKGVISNEPPEVVGPKYPAKLPQLDIDGNEVGGVRMPSVQVPLATYAGWNLPKPEVAEVDENLTNTGSTLPFPFTKEQRLAANDPRLSVKERYGSREAYQARVKAAADLLVAERHLLARDVDAVVAECLKMWDFVAAQ